MTSKNSSPENDPVLKLLKLKSCEVPTPDYFERFIDEFHRRRSAEMLSRPIWRLALDRIASRLVDPARGFSPVERLLAPAAASLVLAAAVAGTIVLKPLEPGFEDRLARIISRAETAPSSPAPTASGAGGLIAETNRLSLDPNVDRIFLEESLRARQSSLPATSPATSPVFLTNRQPPDSTGLSQPRRAQSAPRYVIDARPVSHESPVLSF